MFSNDQLEQLTAPLEPSRVKSREGGGGRSLSYIEAHDAIRTANNIFGLGNWGYTVQELTPLGEAEEVERNDRVGYRIAYRAVVKVSVRVPGKGSPNSSSGVWTAAQNVEFSDVGYGDGFDYSGSELTIHELAMKEAVSDGVKRALKNFGDQFGLSLYDKEALKAIESQSKLANATPARLKREVMKLAREKTGKDRPSQKEVAAAFEASVADLAEVETMKKILREAGLL